MLSIKSSRYLNAERVQRNFPCRVTTNISLMLHCPVDIYITHFSNSTIHNAHYIHWLRFIPWASKVTVKDLSCNFLHYPEMAHDQNHFRCHGVLGHYSLLQTYFWLWQILAHLLFPLTSKLPWPQTSGCLLPITDFLQYSYL